MIHDAQYDNRQTILCEGHVLIQGVTLQLVVESIHEFVESPQGRMPTNPHSLSRIYVCPIETIDRYASLFVFCPIILRYIYYVVLILACLNLFHRVLSWKYYYVVSFSKIICMHVFQGLFTTISVEICNSFLPLFLKHVTHIFCFMNNKVSQNS